MTETPEFVTAFEFDLATPFFEQLLKVFDSLTTAPLAEDQLAGMVSHQGIYGLYRDSVLVYVGKADNPLPVRLRDHLTKLAGRLNISLDGVHFKCVHLARTWGPFAREAMMVAHFREQDLCEWNGIGFELHDPGRRHETTSKPPEGFDSQFPINAELKCSEITAGKYAANELLQKVKASLPFCFRYETDNPKAYRRGSDKYNDKVIKVPTSGMPASKLISFIANKLGPTWQATKFASHIILYEESETYVHGEVLS